MTSYLDRLQRPSRKAADIFDKLGLIIEFNGRNQPNANAKDKGTAFFKHPGHDHCSCVISFGTRCCYCGEQV